jgi:DNA-binding XRE family transcriptional regulator
VDSLYSSVFQAVRLEVEGCRLDLGLRQKDVAERIGANPKTYENWEQERYEPEVRFIPAVTAFLGIDPSTVTSLGGRDSGEAVRPVRPVVRGVREECVKAEAPGEAPRLYLYS